MGTGEAGPAWTAGERGNAPLPPMANTIRTRKKKKGLRGRERLTSSGDGLPDARQLDKDDVSECLLGVVGHADGRDAGVRVVRRPLVVG